jgi:succinate dehydrogenase/fumarate reductase flavoprotein subunit
MYRLTERTRGMPIVINGGGLAGGNAAARLREEWER